MERESFIFYKSFYEATRDLPKDIQLEVYTAIIEYALYGRLPEDLKPIAKGMFTLMKPNIDVNNARYENGKRGGRPRKQRAASAYSLTYEQEVQKMRTDEKFREAVSRDYDITPQEYDIRLSRFLDQCNADKGRKDKDGHSSYTDCQSHLRYWMAKAYRRPPAASLLPSDDSVPFPEMDDTFGGVDYDEQ